MALDVEKFRKVWRLANEGATEGERTSARRRADVMAAKAGLSLADAVKLLSAPRPGEPVNIFAGFDDWMEAREPGHKAREAKARAERNAREAAQRAEILKQYGSEAALFARTEREALLDEAVAHLATWKHWTDDDAVSHRYADTLDGKKPEMGYWYFKDVTPAIRAAVTAAYPWPADLAGVLREVQLWDRLRWDRGLFCPHNEWNHFAEVECRIAILEHEIEEGRPAASFADIQARFDWKRYEFERQWTVPTKRNDPFMDLLEADVCRQRDRLTSFLDAALEAINNLERRTRDAGLDAAVAIVTAARASGIERKKA